MISVDSMVRSLLLRRGYPMHFYLQFLKYGSDCVRELTFSTLKVVKTAIVTVDAGGAFDYPSDYAQWVRIGIPNGQHILPLVRNRNTFNRLQNVDNHGQPVPFDDSNMVNVGRAWAEWFAYGCNFNEYGEFKGGIFDYGAGYETDVFEDIPERRQIQLSQNLASSDIVLDYVPMPNSCDNLTRVTPLAQATIEQYMVWQMKEHGRHYSRAEAKDDERMYNDELRELRARMNPLTLRDINRIFVRGNKRIKY